MRIQLTFLSKPFLELPISYNQTVQGFIYNQLSDPELRQFMHSKGFGDKKRVFKLFSFSKLQGQYQLQKEEKRIRFFDKVTLQVSSLFPLFIQDLASTLIKRDELLLGRNKVQLVSMTMVPQPVIKQTMTVQTLSPIVVYSTLQNEYKKITHYYHPGEPQFSQLIRDNLLHKANALGYALSETDFKIYPLKYHFNRPNIVHYKNFIIRGYSGIFKLEGNLDMMEIAYDCGLGSKNSQGFGMIEEVGGINEDAGSNFTDWTSRI